MIRNQCFKKSLLFLFGIFFCFIADAQSIKGNVVDENSLPLVGVSVHLVGSARGVNTDAEGAFSINAQQGEELELTFIGYASVTRKIDSSFLFIRMERTTNNELSDVVVVGYGT
ncbi:MAG TPA: carboxypeptidase-like regulatory domain-containing protein, partial [Arachidicoccus sp.]|nr:carboxypeptidase-like regulatory domain-containing protein [Arachidicoccus sp.]